uniref:Uncharacterized protein n=1 Tax=Plectus sambesii TaxID=2011161 RepID=A0A914UY42_9BILA
MEVELLIALVMLAAMLFALMGQNRQKQKKALIPTTTTKWKIKGGKEKWVDVKTQASFPANAVAALGHPLELPNGATTTQYIGLLLIRGKAIIGRCWKWNNQPAVASTFAIDGKEVNTVGQHHFQVLTIDQTAHGYVYKWKRMSKLRTPGYDWLPIHEENIAPCVVVEEGAHKLGMADVKGFTAVLAWSGAIVNFAPPVTDDFLVLCRRADSDNKDIEPFTPPDAAPPALPSCDAPRRPGPSRRIHQVEWSQVDSSQVETSDEEKT